MSGRYDEIGLLASEDCCGCILIAILIVVAILAAFYFFS